MIIWSGLSAFLIIGYLSMGRSFAYLGVPPLFIGEIALVAFLLLKPRVALGTWVSALLCPSLLSSLALTVTVFMMYGFWQVARGISSGADPLYAVKLFVFNYYTLYLLLGVWVGLQAPGSLRKTIHVLAWVNGLYGLSYILILRYVNVHILGDVPIFGVPEGSAIAILGLLCFERNLRRVLGPLVLNVFVTLVWQVRAEWLGLAAGMLVWGCLTGRISRLIAVGMAGIVVLGALELAEIRLPGRTGSAVSLSENLGRLIAPIDLELARELSPNAASHASTAEWRELWWKEIWTSVHSTPKLTTFGHGYGFDLFSVAPREMREFEKKEIRTPHSVFYFTLGYTGWVGVVLFVLLQSTILRLLWISFRASRQPVGLVLWAGFLATAFFEAGFELPYRGIPFYLLMGMSIAPAAMIRREGDTDLALSKSHRLSYP